MPVRRLEHILSDTPNPRDLRCPSTFFHSVITSADLTWGWGKENKQGFRSHLVTSYVLFGSFSCKKWWGIAFQAGTLMVIILFWWWSLRIFIFSFSEQKHIFNKGCFVSWVEVLGREVGWLAGWVSCHSTLCLPRGDDDVSPRTLCSEALPKHVSGEFQYGVNNDMRGTQNWYP